MRNISLMGRSIVREPRQPLKGRRVILGSLVYFDCFDHDEVFRLKSFIDRYRA